MGRRDRRKMLVAGALGAAAASRYYSRSRTTQITPVGMFESRCEEDLNRGLAPAADAQHPYSSRFYWEWWYFDAHFDDGHRCVLELQTPNLLNMFADQCAMLFNVYTPDGVEHNNIVPFPGSMWRSSTETCDVAIGDNTIEGYYPEYHVRFSHDGMACDLTFTNLVPGWTRGTGAIMFGPPEREQLFGWVVAQPRAKVSGTITVGGEEHRVEGLGYHDHNWGSGFLPSYVSHWIWGRLSTERFTMIFADIATTRKVGRYQVPLVFLARDDRIVLESVRAECRPSRYVDDSKRFQVYPSVVDFSFAEREVTGEFRFEVQRELEMVDMFGEKLPSALVNPLGKLLFGPAYYRFLADYEGVITIGDERYELSGETHWEYMIMGLRRGKVPTPGRRLSL